MYDGDEIEDVVDYKNVPKYIIDFMIRFFTDARHKVKSNEGKRLIELALVNLKYHPLVPKTDCVIGFRLDDISYSVEYSDFKIEISDYVSVDSGFGWDHYQTFKQCYYPSDEVIEEGDFDSFEIQIFAALNSMNDIYPSEEG